MRLAEALAIVAVAASSVGVSGVAASAAPATAPASVTAVTPLSTMQTSSAVSADGRVVTVALDRAAEKLTIQVEGSEPTVVSINSASITITSGDDLGNTDIVPMEVSKERCKTLLKIAGYSNAVDWMLAAAISSPTVAGAIIAGSAGLITAAMITEAAALC